MYPSSSQTKTIQVLDLQFSEMQLSFIMRFGSFQHIEEMFHSVWGNRLFSYRASKHSGTISATFLQPLVKLLSKFEM
jgi:hypothetical protein